MSRIAIVGAAFLLSACQVASTTPQSLPIFVPIASPAADLPSMDGALLVRAYSGLITSDEDRNLLQPAQLVVLETGQVIANVSDVSDAHLELEYRSLQLSPDELSDIVEELAQIMPTNEPLGRGPHVGDLDAGTTILQARRADGVAVELLAPGLATSVMSREAMAEYSPASVRLDQLASSLRNRVRSEGIAARDLATLVPMVRTARSVGG